MIMSFECQINIELINELHEVKIRITKNCGDLPI